MSWAVSLGDYIHQASSFLGSTQNLLCQHCRSYDNLSDYYYVYSLEEGQWEVGFCLFFPEFSGVSIEKPEGKWTANAYLIIELPVD